MAPDDGTDLDAAVRESNSGVRGPASRTLLRHLAENGPSSTNLDWPRVRAVLLSEVQRALTVALSIYRMQSTGIDKQRTPPQSSAALEELEADVEDTVQQLRQLHRPPFTLQRLAEVLLRPFQYHLTADAASLEPPIGCTDVEKELQLEDGLGISDDDIVRKQRWTFQAQALRPALLIAAIRKTVLVMPVDSVEL